MRDDTPSRTAAWVAAARHLGRLLPQDVRLADDPFGALFTSTVLARLIEDAVAEAPADTPLANALRAVRHPITRVPGLRSSILYMQVRTCVIDDAIRAFVDAGGRQLLLLGAGYDCRALRMASILGGSPAAEERGRSSGIGLVDTRVFEVDHPATQTHKQSVLERASVESPATYVEWDFEARPMEDLADTLAAEGHERTQPTFTIWEGVTMYLSEPAIDISLRAIAEWSAPGSELAMTYFAKDRLAKPSLATRAIQAVVSTFGEPWRWGWTPEELPAYLGERGLELVDDVSLAAAASRLLPPELAAHVTAHDRRVALAAAPESIAHAHVSQE